MQSVPGVGRIGPTPTGSPETQLDQAGPGELGRGAEPAPFGVEASMVKSFLGRFGQKLLTDAIQVEGGMGICEVVPPHFQGTLPLARLFRDMAGTTLLDAPGDFPEVLVAASL